MSEQEHGDKDIPVDPSVGGSEPGEGDPGWIGGGGPASTIDDMDPTDEKSHRPDTDHSIT